MRYATTFLAGLLILALGATANAADEKPAGDKHAGHPHLLHGHITKIDKKDAGAAEITVTIGKAGEEKEVKVETDASTTYSVDHKEAKLDDLKVGELVAIAPSEGTAKHVDVNTTHKDHKGGDAAGKTGDSKTPGEKK